MALPVMPSQITSKVGFTDKLIRTEAVALSEALGQNTGRVTDHDAIACRDLDCFKRAFDLEKSADIALGLINFVSEVLQSCSNFGWE
jgi:hypothetical protein